MYNYVTPLSLHTDPQNGSEVRSVCDCGREGGLHGSAFGSVYSGAFATGALAPPTNNKLFALWRRGHKPRGLGSFANRQLSLVSLLFGRLCDDRMIPYTVDRGSISHGSNSDALILRLVEVFRKVV